MVRRALTCLLAATALVAMVPAAALAQTDRQPPSGEDPVVSTESPGASFERARARVLRQIERRLAALDRLTRKIEGARHLSTDHAAALLLDLASARNTLQAGLTAVGATTSLEELREVAPPIFESTLVFALLTPKTHEVIASNSIATGTDRFTEFSANLQNAIDRVASETDVDTTEAQADLDEMVRLVNGARAAGVPVAGNVIGLQPADWPDPAQAALREGRAALGEARRSLRQARTQAKAVIEFIRSVKEGIDG